MFKPIFVTFALMCSISAYASTAVSTETWSFTTNISATNGSRIALTSDKGNTANISAWSSGTRSGNVSGASLTLDSVWGTQVGQHAVDNQGRYEFILLEFATAVSIKSLVTSWNQYVKNSTTYSGDAWLSVAGYDSSPFSGTQTWAALAALTTVKSSYKNKEVLETVSGITYRKTDFSSSSHVTGAGNNVNNINNIEKSTWIIGAYNSNFNQSTSTMYAGYDKLKFTSLTTQTTVKTGPVVTPVPLPASLYLLAIGLFGFAIRRKC